MLCCTYPVGRVRLWVHTVHELGKIIPMLWCTYPVNRVLYLGHFVESDLVVKAETVHVYTTGIWGEGKKKRENNTPRARDDSVLLKEKS